MLTKEMVADYFGTQFNCFTILGSFSEINSDGKKELFWNVSYLDDIYVFDNYGCCIYKVEN